MGFTHDTEMALQTAVWLVNSAAAPDTLTTTEQLSQLYEEFGFTGRHDGTADELAAVRELRPQLRELLTDDRDTAARRCNELLAASAAVPQLVRHEGYDWHLHAVSADAPLATRITVETAMALFDVVRTDEMSRLAACGDVDCDGIVLDLSRNRSRRYCSVACTNRAASAAYRARQR